MHFQPHEGVRNEVIKSGGSRHFSIFFWAFISSMGSIYENVNDKAGRGQSNFRLLLPDLSRS